MDASFLSERLETARTTFETLERQLADPDVAANPAQLEPIARERSRLEPLVLGYAELQTLRGQEQQASTPASCCARAAAISISKPWPRRNWRLSPAGSAPWRSSSPWRCCPVTPAMNAA